MEQSVWWLLLSALLFPLMVVVAGYYFKRKIDRSFEGWKKYETLRDQVLKDWQMEQQQKFCRLKTGLEELEDEIRKLASRDEVVALSKNQNNLGIGLTRIEEQIKAMNSVVGEHRRSINDIYSIINRRKSER